MSGLIQEMKIVVESIVGDENQSHQIVYALIKRFGGERLYLPCHDYEKRNREIIELYQYGASYTALAKRFHIAERTVRRIVNSNEKNT